MGSTDSKVFEKPPKNGQCLLHDLHPDVLREILLRVERDSLKKCFSVCKLWNGILQDPSFWLELCDRVNISLPPVKLRPQYEFNYKKIAFRQPFQRNLIHNPSGKLPENQKMPACSLPESAKQCTRKDRIPKSYRCTIAVEATYLDSSSDSESEEAQQPAAFGSDNDRKAEIAATMDRVISKNDNFQGWLLLENGGDNWRVEQPPAGADHENEEGGVVTSCFATSYRWCTKEQVIILDNHGIDDWVMDKVKPKIVVSERAAARFDCASDYEICVKLMAADGKTFLDDFRKNIHTEQWAGKQWQKVEHEFTDYPEGVRYVCFQSRGKDTQFWAGHYGCKMCDASVVVSFEPPKVPAKNDEAMGGNIA